MIIHTNLFDGNVHCPKCDSDQIADVIYGKPGPCDDLEARVAAGTTVVAGCNIGADQPLYPYECMDCHYRFDDAMAKRLTAKEYFSAEDYAFIEEMADLGNFYCDEEDDPDTLYPERLFKLSWEEERRLAMLSSLASAILENNPDWFVRMLMDADAEARSLSGDEEFTRLTVLGLEYGVAYGDAACANYLGAQYYLGGLVEQDYGKAEELYAKAEAAGSIQAAINLGYIYEYGRLDEPDYDLALKQYLKGLALSGGRHPEALYKLGDMYSRGKAVPRDLRAAYELYRTSYSLCYDDETAAAQAAIRIANLISDRANREFDIPYDPMEALALYQLAERGLRVDINAGQTYYQGRLQEAIEGQDRMRELLAVPFSSVWNA